MASLRGTSDQTEQLLIPKQQRVLQYIEELDTIILNSTKKAQLGVQESIDLIGEGQTRKERGKYLLDKPSEEYKKVEASIGQVLTAVKGLRPGLSGALAEKEKWHKENLNP